VNIFIFRINETTQLPRRLRSGFRMLAASFAHVNAALWRGVPDSPEGLDGFPLVSYIVTITTVYHLAQHDQ
jgi:hypothetical protein